MRKLIFIIGLPGSGKTYLIENEYSSPEWICYDDYRANSIENNGEFTKSRHYPFLIYELVKGNKNIIISDIAFCDNLILEDAKKILTIGKLIIQLILPLNAYILKIILTNVLRISIKKKKNALRWLKVSKINIVFLKV